MDPEKEAAKAGARAIIESGKDAAKRLYEDLTRTDEEKERLEAERAAAKKKKRSRWMLYLIGGAIAFVCLLFLLAKIWPYVLGLAIVAGLAYWGYRKLVGPKDDKSEKDDDAAAEAKPVAKKAAPKRIAPPVEKVRVEAPPEEDLGAKVAAREAAAAERERAIDDELAALKRKAGK